MRVLLIVLFVYTTIFSSSSCFCEFQPIVDNVERGLQHEKLMHEQSYPNEKYIYRSFPTILFPYFCIPADTLKKFPKYNSVYLCSWLTNVGVYVDKTKTVHYQFATLQYITIKNNLPYLKNYTLYFYRLNSFTRKIEEERRPVVLVFKMNKDSTYACVKVK